jgi:Holliday junction DNA helicase RuvA
MIGFLRGTLLEKKADHVILDVNGVGYEIEIPASSLCLLPQINKQASLYILTFVREDAIRLFGFATDFDKKVFVSLTNVSGIGPKAALGLLGPADGQELCEMIIENRVERLTTIPGVGLKTAERLVLELRTKLQKLLLRYQDDLGLLYQAEENKPLPMKSEKWLHRQTIEDLKSALSNLGYKDKQYLDVVAGFDKRMQQGEDIPFEVALKQSLKKLSEHVLKN